MAVNPIPAGYHTVTPFIPIASVDKVLEFIEKAFGGVMVDRIVEADGVVTHAEVRIGDSMVMLGDPRDPARVMPAVLYLYVPDVDATYQAALGAGGESIREPATQFYGDRNSAVKDMAGNHWWIATHVENVSKEEIARRAAEQANP